MPDVISVSFDETGNVQTVIMQFVSKWVREKRTPVPKQEILAQMETDGIKSVRTINALNSLVNRGYIRRAHVISNKAYYVQLRGI